MCIRTIAAALIFTLTPASQAFAANITVSVKGEKLEFQPASFTVKAGEKVKLLFKNASKSMQHNLVIGKPGTADKITADSIAAGASKDWVSSGPEVLAKTKMIDPTKTETIEFTVPADKGTYPYLCTFPGHGQVMRGKMEVK